MEKPWPSVALVPQDTGAIEVDLVEAWRGSAALRAIAEQPTHDHVPGDVGDAAPVIGALTAVLSETHALLRDEAHHLALAVRVAIQDMDETDAATALGFFDTVRED